MSSGNETVSPFSEKVVYSKGSGAKQDETINESTGMLAQNPASASSTRPVLAFKATYKGGSGIAGAHKRTHSDIEGGNAGSVRSTHDGNVPGEQKQMNDNANPTSHALSEPSPRAVKRAKTNREWADKYYQIPDHFTIKKTSKRLFLINLIESIGEDAWLGACEDLCVIGYMECNNPKAKRCPPLATQHMQPTLALKETTSLKDIDDEKRIELYRALIETLPLKYAMLLAIWRWVAYAYSKPIESYNKYIDSCQVDELRGMIPVESSQKRGAYHLSEEGFRAYGVWKHQPTVSVTLIPFYRGSMQKIKATPRRQSDFAHGRNETLSKFPWFEEGHLVSIARRRFLCFACPNILYACLFAQKQLWPVSATLFKRRPFSNPRNQEKPASEATALKEWETW